MRYHTQLIQRTLLQELLHGMRQVEMDPSGIRTLLVPIDSMHRELTISAPFQWDPQLLALYPAEEYWWLYRQTQSGTINQFLDQTSEQTWQRPSE